MHPFFLSFFFLSILPINTPNILAHTFPYSSLQPTYKTLVSQFPLPRFYRDIADEAQERPREEQTAFNGALNGRYEAMDPPCDGHGHELAKVVDDGIDPLHTHTHTHKKKPKTTRFRRWLRQHPETKAELARQRVIKQIWRDHRSTICMFLWPSHIAEHGSTGYGCESYYKSGQLNRENVYFHVPVRALRIWSRETGSAVLSRVSLLILHTTQAEKEIGAHDTMRDRLNEPQAEKRTPREQSLKMKRIPPFTTAIETDNETLPRCLCELRFRFER